MIAKFKDDIFPFFAAIIILFTSWTVFYQLPLGIYLSLFLAVYIFFFKRVNNPKNIRCFVLFFILSLWYFRPMGFDLGALLEGFVRSFMISSLFLLPSDVANKIVKYIVLLLCPILLVGIITHILITLGLYNLPQIAFVSQDDREYEVYFLTVYQYNTSMRFSSIFDEPGYLGTICAFLLAINKFDFKKISNIILLTGGILSLSVAFYVMMFISICFISFNKRRFYLIFIISIVIFVIGFFLPDFFSYLLERDELISLGSGNYTDSRGGIAGAIKNLDRINSFGFLESLLGNGYDAPLFYFHYNTNALASSSIFRLIFQIGYLGVCYLLFFIIINTKRNFYSILFSLLFILSLYQRPQIFTMILTLFLTVGLDIKKQKMM